VKEKEHVGREFNPFFIKWYQKHEILNEDEIKEQLLFYNIDKEQLPKIRVTDPAAVAAKSKVGDVIRVTRTAKCRKDIFLSHGHRVSHN